jgi:hypothetical protein
MPAPSTTAGETVISYVQPYDAEVIPHDRAQP